MYCPNCGKELKDNSVKFCPECGTNIDGSSSSKNVPSQLDIEPKFNLRRAMLIICALFAIASVIYIAITYDSYLDHYTVEGSDAILCGVLVIISVITGVIGLCSKK